MTLKIKTNGEGYEYVEEERGGTPVYIHRLIAVAEYGFEAVTSEMDVHHKISVSWLNFADNLEPKEKWEHRIGHLEEANEKRRKAKLPA